MSKPTIYLCPQCGSDEIHERRVYWYDVNESEIVPGMDSETFWPDLPDPDPEDPGAELHNYYCNDCRAFIGGELIEE